MDDFSLFADGLDGQDDFDEDNIMSLAFKKIEHFKEPTAGAKFPTMKPVTKAAKAKAAKTAA